MDENLFKILKARHSVRAFLPEKVDNTLLRKVMEMVQMAPSAVNKQPYRFVVVSQPSLLQKITDAYSRDWFKTAPVCIVAIADHAQSWHRSVDGKDFAEVDAAIAIDHLTLAACSVGLGTCWVCNFDASLIASLLQLAENEEPIALIPIGYAANEAIPSEKVRKSVDELVIWK